MKVYAEFNYYLDAWRYCWHNKLGLDKITRKDLRTWVVSY